MADDVRLLADKEGLTGHAASVCDPHDAKRQSRPFARAGDGHRS